MIERAAALLLLAGVAAAARADDTARLLERLEAIDTFAAAFEQRVYGARHELLQASTGRIRAARPNRFKWVVEEPFPQVITTSDDKLYVYDPDLEQVQVRDLGPALTGTPALLLIGDLEKVERQFDVAAFEDDGGEHFVLRPRVDGAAYDELRLVFDPSGTLVSIEVEDALGQSTEITFSGVRQNAVIESDVFEFEIPPGSDVIGDVDAAASAG